MATVSGTDRDLIFPMFKFQRPEHSIATCRSGNIHLSKITELRQRKCDGQMADAAEGTVTIFEPIDVNGLHQFLYRPQTTRINEAFIFCAATNVVSQSLLWAINVGKSSCVLLTDIDEVMRRINAAVPELSFAGFRRCVYRSKTLFTLPGDIERSSRQAEFALPWIKPIEYRDQLEARAVWIPKQYPTQATAIIRDVPVDDLCIPVSYSGMYPFVEDSNRPLRVKVEILGVDRPISFFMRYPDEVMSPVIHRLGEQYCLSFTPNASTDADKTFFGNAPLEQVESIRYSVEE